MKVAITLLLASQVEAIQWTKRVKMAPRRIIDADGDGVEDNRAVSRNWLDRFGEDVYGYNIDDINNTHNGELPGHERWGEDPRPKYHWTTPFDERTDDAPEDGAMIQATVANYSNIIKGPEDLQLLSFSRDFVPFEKRPMYDADGDGVEDNMKLTSEQLDKFYKPNVYGAEIQYIYNTRHGNLPGERNKWFYDKQSEPENTYDVVKKNWNRLGDKV